MKSRRFAMALALVLSIGVVAPSDACPWDCTEGSDLNGNAFVHCWEYLSGHCTSGECYSDCAERNICYRTADGYRFCYPYCDGEPCFLA